MPDAKGVDALRAAVLADVALHDALLRLDPGPGFAVAAAAVARRHGFEVTAEDLEAAVQQARRAWIERAS